MYRQQVPMRLVREPSLQMPSTTQYLEMIAAHLNAPYGPVVHPGDVAAALRGGDLTSLPGDELAKELVASMFIELEPEFIGRASYEAGVRLEEANALYQQARSQFGLPRSARWETALEGVL